jgi:GDP-L-fucose synthase
MEIVGLEGDLRFDSTRADGMPRKLLDSERLLRMGWRARIDLTDGLLSAYEWFLANNAEATRQRG